MQEPISLARPDIWSQYNREHEKCEWKAYSLLSLKAATE